MAKIYNRALLVAGELQKVGTPVVRIITQDKDGKVTRASGATLPTDTDAGYAVGCIFTKTTGVIGATVYINEGSASSCDFNAVAASSSGFTTWDALYDNDQTLVIDSTTLTFSGTHATNDTVTISATGGSGDCLQFSQAGSGSDVKGTSSTWSVSKAGAGTFATLISTSFNLTYNLTL